jgi:hypothetical protein
VAPADEQPGTAGSQGAAGRGSGDYRSSPQVPGDRPRPYSYADLRQRLGRLPRGHPSCPFNADGSRKPPPPNLRELELEPGE